MAIDIYSTRAQLAAIELMPREYTFLYDTFCADMGAVEDDKAIYDFKKGSRQMAPVVHPGTGGVVMGRDGFETREIGFCTVAPERIITNPDLQGRAFGEKVLGAMTPEQRESAVKSTHKLPPRPKKTQKKETSPASTDTKVIDKSENRAYIDVQEILGALSPDEKAAIGQLTSGEKHIDQIIAATRLPAARITSALTLLQIKGYVRALPGKRFSLAEKQ